MALLLAVYLAWFAVVLRRLLIRPLPRPADVVQLSLFFYNVPLAVLSVLGSEEAFGEYRVFLDSLAGDSALASRTLLLNMIASLAVVAGSAFGRLLRRGAPSEFLLPVGVSLQRITARLALACLPIIAGGIVLFGVDAFFAGYAVESAAATSISGTALIFFSYEVIGLCAFLWICSRLATGDSNGSLSIGLTLLCLLVLTLLRGKRLELIIALLPLSLVLWSSLLRRPLHRAVTIGMAIAALSSLASLRSGEIPTLESLAFNTFSEGLYAGHVNSGVIDAVDRGELAPEHGVRLLAGLAAFVPRFVLRDKDELLYRSMTDIGQFAPLGATSTLAEVYLQAGIPAVVLWFLLVGVIAGRLELNRFSAPGTAAIHFRAVLYVLFVCSFVPHFRDGLIPSIKIPLQLMLVFVLVAGFAGMRLRPVVRHRAPRRGGGHSSGKIVSG